MVIVSCLITYEYMERVQISTWRIETAGWIGVKRVNFVSFIGLNNMQNVITSMVVGLIADNL